MAADQGPNGPEIELNHDGRPSVPSPRSVTLSTYLEPEEAELVRARARAGDRSVAAELRRLLRPYLQNDARPADEPGAVTTPAVGGRASAAG